jgi:hypothetical protein
MVCCTLFIISIKYPDYFYAGIYIYVLARDSLSPLAHLQARISPATTQLSLLRRNRDHKGTVRAGRSLVFIKEQAFTCGQKSSVVRPLAMILDQCLLCIEDNFAFQKPKL